MSGWKRVGRIFATVDEACAAVGIEVPKKRLGAWGNSPLIGRRGGKQSGRVHWYSVTGDRGQVWSGGSAFNHSAQTDAVWLENWAPDDKTEDELTPAERRRRMRESRRMARRMAEAAEQITRQHQAAAAKVAADLLAHASAGNPADPHPYLRLKHLADLADCVWEISWSAANSILASVPSPTGIAKQRPPGLNRLILVPLGCGGEVRSVEFIDEGGQKRHLRDGQKQGCYWLPCSDPGVRPRLIGIAEGLATALSASVIYDLPVAIAIDAGNLLPAARSILNDYPDAQVVFFADNDPEREYAGEAINRGVHDALEAARSLPSHRLAQTPQFPDGVIAPAFTEADASLFRRVTGKTDPPSDFNDLLIIRKTKAAESLSQPPSSPREEVPI